jgi:hypothetical protein
MIRKVVKRAKREWVNVRNREENKKVKDIISKNTNSQPIYHIHIRKTGGKSINFAFLSNSKTNDTALFYKQLIRKPNNRVIANNKVFVGWNKKLIKRGLYSYAFSHEPFHELNLPSHVFTFTCLRDPAKRVISHYNMLKYYQKNNIRHFCMKEEGPWLGNSFEDFLDNIPRKHLCNQLYMFSKRFNVEEAFENIMSCNYFFFTENLTEGLKTLEQKTGWELPVFYKNKLKHKEEITDKQLEILKEKLQDEYELINRLKKEQKKE